MPIEKRMRGRLDRPGPFLAEVTNNIDPTYMGNLEVALIKGMAMPVDVQAGTFTVKYLSPFYGVTSLRYEGNNPKDFNDVQKSYGMWAIPPDIGTIVMVIFVDGDPQQGYWIGCVPDQFQNHMVPGIAASKRVDVTPEQREKYGTDYLPVAEFHKSSRKLTSLLVHDIPKPVHPFADRLLAQGLLLDTVRGVTSSSARRDLPSSVFGISTPGPIDKNGKKVSVGYETKKMSPVSRLGGSTFVMDDGDVNGLNELVRIRTRTGHQILLHNSADLIYIANSKGTAWIELTSMGKIDIYAEDSVSIHTKGDFNLRADRDFNLEAGRNFNVAAAEGEVNFNARKNFNLIADEMKIGLSGNYNLISGKDLKLSATGNINTAAGGEYKNSATGSFSIASGAALKLGSSATLSLSGSVIRASAGKIDLNGPAADAPSLPEFAEQPKPLNLYSVPQRDSAAGWAGGKYYKAENLITTLQRVPSHEPWDQHEDINPQQFTLDKTDTAIEAPAKTSNNTVVVPPTASANTPYPAKNGPAADRGTVRKEKFPWTTDRPFLDKVKQVAASLKFDPIDLLAFMNLESARTFDPAITNDLGYTGLIQFGSAAAQDLGTTTSYLRQLSRVQQMDWVEKYFRFWKWPTSKCPNPTLANLYLTILLPSCRFYAPDQKVADASDPKTRNYYLKNPGFDPKKLGYFTAEMVGNTVLSHKREVLQCLSNAGVTL